jgi:hypothetical protein
MPTTQKASFEDLVLMILEATDGIEYQQAKKILKLLFPGIRINVVRGKDDEYLVTWPDE